MVRQMKLIEILQKGVEQLKQRSIEQPSLKVRIVVANCLGYSKEQLILKEEQIISKEDQLVCQKAIDKLADGVPLQYITNQQEFMKMPFYVDENVLIPRADTEILVEEVIKSGITKETKLLDLCTGSGAIAIAVAKNTQIENIVAIDISENAIEIAKKNAKSNGVNTKIKFKKSDLFSEIEHEVFDIIVSNPPYISKQELQELQQEVKKEPSLALDGGIDGLDFYRSIANQAAEHLKRNGKLFLEIGYQQKGCVIELLQKQEKFHQIVAKRDLAGNDRVIIARKAE